VSFGGRALPAVAVGPWPQAKIFAQRSALVLGAEQAAALQFRHNHVDEVFASAWQDRRRHVETVACHPSNHSCMTSAISVGVDMPSRLLRAGITGSPLQRCRASNEGPQRFADILHVFQVKYGVSCRAHCIIWQRPHRVERAVHRLHFELPDAETILG